MELIPYQDIEKMGIAVAESALFGIKTKQQAVALMLVAQALGKHPALAAMEYNIIQGRPAKKADAMLIDFQASGGKLEWHSLTDEKAEATFSHPSGGSLKLDWTIDRAKKAGLFDKEGSMYKKYPRQMLRARLVADGVRAVYPAATGGMLSKEEAEDIIDVTANGDKSRVEQIIDTQHEVKEDVKKVESKSEVVKEDKKKDSKKSKEQLSGDKNKGTDVSSVSDSDSLPEGHHIIVGVIDTEAQDGEGKLQGYKTATVDKEGKPTLKHSFLIEGKRYGTFDGSMANQIVECMDKNIMIKIEYKERPTAKAVLNDIVSFKQAVAGVDYLVK